MKLNLLLKILPIEIILDSEVRAEKNMTNEHCFGFLFTVLTRRYVFQTLFGVYRFKLLTVAFRSSN